MPELKRKLRYIFARDFSLWINELIRDAYVHRFPVVWGRGLEDQVVYYDGRTARWFRYVDNYEELTDFMVQQPLDLLLFREHTYQEFRQNANRLRQCITSDPKKLAHTPENLEKIIDAFQTMYPMYTLSVFLAGAWRERFLQQHGSLGEIVVERVYQSRTHSEGLVKLTDTFIRAWLGGLCEDRDLPAWYVKLLRYHELQQVVEKGDIPARETLDQRQQGYVYIGGEVHPMSNFKEFLFEHVITLEDESVHKDTSVSGTVAKAGGLIQGKVQVIYNSEDVHTFIPGSILVTPMTSPEYLLVMKNATAIITDEGGLTCHAAITARELNVPCIIGTKVATKIFQDGDMVEVDAQRGMVKKL